MDKDDSLLGYTGSQYKLFRRYALRYLILFSITYMTLYCCRLNLANASAALIKDLSFTKSDIGIITSVLFWTYGIGQFVNGRLSEIFDTDIFIFLAVILSVAANVVFGFQLSLPVMVIIWAFNGFFQSMAWAPGIATITRWFPKKKRGFAVGFAYAFSGFGQVAAALAVASSLKLFPPLGWRAAFFIPAVLPLTMVIFFRIFAKGSPSKIGLPDYKEEKDDNSDYEEGLKKQITGKGFFYPYKAVLTNKRFIPWIFIAFAAGITRYGLVTWIPLYFVDKFDIDIANGLIQSMALPVGMGVGALLVPVLTDKFCPNDRLPAIIISSLSAAVLVSLFLTLNPTHTLQMILAEVILFFAGFCIYAINGVVWTYAADVGGRVLGGTCTGVLNFAAYLGAGSQSIVYGFILEKAGWITVFASVSALCVIISVISIICRKIKTESKNG